MEKKILIQQKKDGNGVIWFDNENVALVINYWTTNEQPKHYKKLFVFRLIKVFILNEKKL